MERSQHRTGRAKERPPGRGIKRSSILGVALVAAAGAFLSFENGYEMDDRVVPTTDDCEQHHMSRPDCLLPATTSESTASAVEGMGRADSPEAEPLADERNRLPRRAWQQQDPESVLRPGYTLVELCANSPDLAVTHCQPHTTKEMHALANTRGSGDGEAGFAIAGHVLSAEGEPLDGVSIVALPERLDDDAITLSENLRFWTITDALGAYSFSGLPAGEYMIRSARHGSYQAARVSARTGIDYADLIMARNVDVVVEGRVVGRFGEPLDGVTVIPTLLGQASVQTGADGRFRLSLSVKPDIDSLTLRFQMDGYTEQSSRIRLGNYPKPMTAEVEVAMDMVQSWTAVKGVVTDDTGQPLVGRRVELRPQAGRRTQTTTTDTSGRYDFAFVESPADYWLVVSGDNEYKDVERAIRVTTSMSEVDIVAEAFDTGAVVGRLVNQNGLPVTDFELVLKNVDSRKPNAAVRTDSLGNFEIPTAPAGELVISSVSTPSILVRGLHLEPGERIQLSMVLDWGDHSIRGQVVDSRGHPVPASRVVLNWSHQDEQLNTHTTRRTATDAQGRFAFNNLGPGPHSLKVDAPGFLGVDIDHDLSRQGYDLTVRLN